MVVLTCKMDFCMGILIIMYYMPLCMTAFGFPYPDIYLVRVIHVGRRALRCTVILLRNIRSSLFSYSFILSSVVVHFYKLHFQGLKKICFTPYLTNRLRTMLDHISTVVSYLGLYISALKMELFTGCLLIEFCEEFTYLQMRDSTFKTRFYGF